MDKLSAFRCVVCGKDLKDGWAIYRISPKGEPFSGVCNDHRLFPLMGAPDVAGMIEDAQCHPDLEKDEGK